MLSNSRAEGAFADAVRGRGFAPNEPRDSHGRWTDGGGEDTEISFVSPNVASLTFDQAAEKLNSGEQRRLATVGNYIDTKLGITNSTNRNALGAWSDGAENSMMVIAHGASPAQMRAAAAMKGYLADQKAVLVFTPKADGQHQLLTFDVKDKSLAAVHEGLLQDGLAFHTLEDLGGDNYRIHAMVGDQSMQEAAERAAERYDVTGKSITGNGEFIGTTLESGSDREQRDDARRIYEQTIAEVSVPGRDIGGIWHDVRDYWSSISAEEKRLRRGFDPSEPRDEAGRWTDGGGSDGKSEHPGPGYSANARVIDGVIHTNNVYDAQRALFENRKVELKQLKQVSTLIKRLGETAAEMAEAGETAPTFNLCNVSVEGTSVFCHGHKGIPRVEMPVIPAKRTKEFIKYLKDRGYKVEKGKEQARNLRATQSEISGAKVAASMKRIKQEGFYKRLVISRDDYIVDGHHTWAGQLGLDAKNGNLKDDDRSVKIARVDIPILKLVEEAEKFTGGKGKKPASEAPKGFSQLTMRQASVVLPPQLFKKYYGAACEFFAVNAHLAPRNIDELVVVVRSEPLYVHRDLQNTEAFVAWAHEQGFEDVNDDLHVTVLYSKTPVDWDDMGNVETDHLVVPAGGERSLEVLGNEGAVALVFASTALARRHGEMIGDGASSDYDAYVPHVTICMDGAIPDGAVPYDGELIFGPEIFETIDDTKTKEWDEDKHPRVPAGSPAGGQFGSGGGGDTSEAGDGDVKLDPKVVEVGGDEWNRQVARKLEREYQAAKPALEKITNNAVTEGKMMFELNAPGDAAWAALSHDEQQEAFNTWRKEQGIDDYDEAKAQWDALSDSEKAKINDAQLSMTGETDEEEEEDEDDPYYPDEWEGVNDATQNDVMEAWKAANFDSYLEQEQQSWYDNGQALGEAKGTLAYEFSKANDEWAQDAMDELVGERDEDGEKPFPFTTEQILDSMELEYEDNHGDGSDDPDMGFDDTKLDKLTPKGVDPAQMDFPGIDKPEPSKLLTEEMRDAIKEKLTEAFNKEADKKQSDMEAPDYLKESVDEYLDMAWGEMSDKDKFDWGYEHDQIDKPPSESDDTPSPSKPVDPMRVEALPSKFDPLNETTGADYLRTQRLAHYLSIMRARELIHDRLEMDTYPSREIVAAADKRLWSEWKGSSTSEDGRLLQVATAEELGGRLNLRTATGLHVDELKVSADNRYKSIGGYKGVLAYIRAKWETTQFLLDKAGTQELELYRGLDLARNNSDAFDAAMKEKSDRIKQMVTYNPDPSYASDETFTKLPTVKVDRNGAASTTTDIGVANGWAGGGKGKITLRAVVPRTAAISIPAYGINVHGEHEVVIAGTAWKGWDAWAGKAPTISKVPMGPKGSGIGTNAPVQAA